MIRWPAADRLSKVAAPIIERFKKTAAAKDLEQDARDWALVSWPWLPEAPYALTLRAPDGEERYCVVDADGMWTMRALPGAMPAATA